MTPCTTMSPPAVIDYACFPHIVERIIEFAPTSWWALRQTCKAIKARIDREGHRLELTVLSDPTIKWNLRGKHKVPHYTTAQTRTDVKWMAAIHRITVLDITGGHPIAITHAMDLPPRLEVMRLLPYTGFLLLEKDFIVDTLVLFECTEIFGSTLDV